MMCNKNGLPVKEFDHQRLQIRVTKITSKHMARKEQIRNSRRKCRFISEYYLASSWNSTSGNG
jgi:hypothetical protein